MHDHKPMKVDGLGSGTSPSGPSQGHTAGRGGKDPSAEGTLDWTLNLVESYFASRSADT